LDCGGKRSATPLFDRAKNQRKRANLSSARRRCRRYRSATALQDAAQTL